MDEEEKKANSKFFVLTFVIMITVYSLLTGSIFASSYCTKAIWVELKLYSKLNKTCS